MKICLEGINAYAKNLAQEAWRLASQEKASARKDELLHLAEICRRVPEIPVRPSMKRLMPCGSSG